MLITLFRLKLPTVASLLTLALFTIGCGGDVGGSLARMGLEEQTAGQGSLTFRFGSPQASPLFAEMAGLRFDVYTGEGGTGNLLLTQSEAFALQVTLVNVPLSARSVVITSSNKEGFPTGTLVKNVLTSASLNAEFDLNGADFTPVTVTHLSTVPEPLAIDVGGTGSFTVTATFSNSAVISLPVSVLGFTLADPGPASEEEGIFRGLSPGSTAVTVSFRHGGTETSTTGSLVVGNS